MMEYHAAIINKADLQIFVGNNLQYMMSSKKPNKPIYRTVRYHLCRKKKRIHTYTISKGQ